MVGGAQGSEVADRVVLIARRFASRGFPAPPSGPILSDAPATVGQEVRNDVTTPPPAGPGPPRLLDRVRQAIRARHYSFRTEKAYVGWIRRFIFFYDKQHPAELGTPEVIRFLEHLATAQRVAASTQNQAFSALLFLFRLCSAEHKRGYVAVPVMWCSGRNLLRIAGQ